MAYGRRRSHRGFHVRYGRARPGSRHRITRRASRALFRHGLHSRARNYAGYGFRGGVRL